MRSSLSLLFIENSHLQEKKKKLYNCIAWLTKRKKLLAAGSGYNEDTAMNCVLS